MRPRTLYFIVSAALIVVLLGWIGRSPLQQWWQNRDQGNVPQAITLLENANVSTNANIEIDPEQLLDSEGTEGSALPEPSVVPELIPDADVVLAAATPLPADVNIKVPFTSQAPHANWDADHGEFCEEASTLMVGRYFVRRGIKDANDAEAALQRLKQREVQLFGYHKDTTASETAQLIADRYPVTVSLLKNPTALQMKRLLAAGKLIVLPAAGRELKNPNFRSPGPLYHMLVVKGYTSSGRFITNDPGTRNGADYTYSSDRLVGAIHDWNDGDVPNGQRIVIVISAKS